MSRNRTLGAPYEQFGVTASFTTEPHIDRYLVSAPDAGPAVTVTLDPSAQDGDQVVILDAAGNAGTASIVVLPSAGQTIDGDAVISTDGGSVELTYSFGLTTWTVRGAGNFAPPSALAPSATTVIASGITGTPATFSANPYTSISGNMRIDAVASFVSAAGSADPCHLSIAVDGVTLSTTLVAQPVQQPATGAEAELSLSTVVRSFLPGAHTISLTVTSGLGDAITLGGGGQPSTMITVADVN